MTLPAHIDWALRQIGVVPAPAKAPPRQVNLKGNYYPDGDIPF
jgi:hypothetical protein